ncbi:MAG: CBS domain-containing protein [Solirubrobacterales bacterium]
MKVRDRMTATIITMGPDNTVMDAVNLMKKHNIRRVPVIDRGRLSAMVTRSNLYRAMPVTKNSEGSPILNEQWALRTKIRDVIPPSQELITISPDAAIEQGAAILREQKVGGLPVVDENGKLIGMLSVIDILGAFLDMFGVNKEGTTIRCAVDDNLRFIQQTARILDQEKTPLEHIVTIDAHSKGKLISFRIPSDGARRVVDELKEVGYEIDSITVKG